MKEGGFMDNANDFIIIRAARENNLKNFDINIPKGKIVVFAGASGSGKSSLVFNTSFFENDAGHCMRKSLKS